VSSFQGAICTENSNLGPDEVSLFHRMSLFRRVAIYRFHCTSFIVSLLWQQNMQWKTQKSRKWVLYWGFKKKCIYWILAISLNRWHTAHFRFLCVQWTSDIRTSDIRTLANRDTQKHVPAKVVLYYPRLLIRTLAYKDNKMLVPEVSLYPRFTVL
jgi:hypothetical protein